MALDMERPSEPALGRKQHHNDGNKRTDEQMGRNGARKRFHVRSDIEPTIGWTRRPIRGEGTKKKLKSVRVGADCGKYTAHLRKLCRA